MIDQIENRLRALGIVATEGVGFDLDTILRYTAAAARAVADGVAGYQLMVVSRPAAKPTTTARTMPRRATGPGAASGGS